jgi:hypothetical protein
MNRLQVFAILLFAGAMLFVGACGSDDEKPASNDSGSVALPGDFPEQVPLIEGSVLAAGGTAQEGWNLTVAGAADAGNPFDNASTRLTDGGFTEEFAREEGGQTVKGYSADKDGKTYTVVIGTTAGSAVGPNSITYLVSVR